MPKGRKQAEVAPCWDRGLRELEAKARRGRHFTQQEIAEACNVTKGAVYMLEKRAMKKLCNAVLFTPTGAAPREIKESKRIQPIL